MKTVRELGDGLDDLATACLRQNGSKVSMEALRVFVCGLEQIFPFPQYRAMIAKVCEQLKAAEASSRPEVRDAALDHAATLCEAFAGMIRASTLAPDKNPPKKPRRPRHP